MNIFAGLAYRLRLLYFYLINSDCRNRVTLDEMRNHLFSQSSESFANRNVSLVSHDTDFKTYKVKGYRDYFYYPSNAPIHSFAGVITEGLKQDHWHYYEIRETRVTKGDVIVDCGSAEGFFAFKYKDVAKNMFLIEPLPLFINALKKNFGHLENIQILAYALSDKSGTDYLYLNSETSVLDATLQESGNEKITIETKTIDELFFEKGISINYLKADVEGFEEKLILGALNTIKDSKPKIVITTYHKGQDYKRLIQILKTVVPEYNFKVKGIEHHCGNPVMLHFWI